MVTIEISELRELKDIIEKMSDDIMLQVIFGEKKEGEENGSGQYKVG